MSLRATRQRTTASLPLLAAVQRLLLLAAIVLGTCNCAAAMPPPRALPTAHPYARPPGTDVRVVAYNVWKNSLLRGGELQARFTRMARALNADVWLLQEVWGANYEVAALFDSILPLPQGRSWHVRRAKTQVTVSRWPILGHRSTTGMRTGWFVGLSHVDLPNERFSHDLYAINVGMTCCGGTANDPKRQAQGDELARWLRLMRKGVGPIRLPRNTPIVVGGDLNIIASRQPMETVRTGNIIDERRFGRDMAPDWDGTALTDARPRHNGRGGDWTWRSDGSRFAPGRLDYILYTDSVAKLLRTFSVETTTLPPQLLASAGLRKVDVVVGLGRNGRGFRWDHLPLVVDLRFSRGPPGG